MDVRGYPAGPIDAKGAFTSEIDLPPIIKPGPALALTKVDPLSLTLTDRGGAQQWVTKVIFGSGTGLSAHQPATNTLLNALCSTRAGGVVEKLGTPFVPTPSGGHGAQGRSRDETACGARLGARPLTAPSTVAPPCPQAGGDACRVSVLARRYSPIRRS